MPTLPMCMWTMQGKKSGYVPAPNSSKCAMHMHFEHLPSLFSALESLDFLEWEEMGDAGYTLFNYVWLYRMMTMASCIPGHPSGAILGIYAVLCAQTDSTSQSALGTLTSPVSAREQLLTFQHLPLLPVVLPSLCCLATGRGAPSHVHGVQKQGEARLGTSWCLGKSSMHLAKRVLKSYVPETR